MLSNEDLERLIAVKRREIEKEKTRLGLQSRLDESDNKENAAPKPASRKVSGERVAEQNEREEKKGERETEEIPPDLERYIRRYLGLPVMLKAGEYSPNNPLIRGERASGDALLGLGEYERRRNTLRKLRQQQYREYLDQQAKKKQEEKEKADRERREREQREREQEERERERERDIFSPERSRAYTSTVFNATQTFTSKVDTGVQTNNTVGRPLSVAVQTDDAELYRLSPVASRACPLSRAERELAPRRSLPELEPTLLGRSERYEPSLLDADAVQQRNERAEKEAAAKRQFYQQELKNQILEQERIREERKAREKLLEAAEMRRLEEQLRMLRGAQERELGKQCAREHQIKENATDYEKKRTALQKEIDYEQQSLFRAPRLTTSHSDSLPSKLSKPSKLPFYYPSVHKLSKDKQPYSTNIPDTSVFSPNYDVDSYLRRNLNPSKEMLSSRLHTTNSECLASKYLDRYDRDNYNMYIDKEDSKRFNDRYSDKEDPKRFNDRYSDKEDPKRFNDRYNDKEDSKRFNDRYSDKEDPKRFNDRYNDKEDPKKFNDRYSDKEDPKRFNDSYNDKEDPKRFNAYTNEKQDNNLSKKKVVVEALVHERPKYPKDKLDRPKAHLKENDNPIPVLRHSPVSVKTVEKNTDLSDAMQVVDDKWKVPAVQKNILKNLPNEEGKSVSILTQLGSIRRQLQLEQLKLDKMLTKE